MATATIADNRPTMVTQRQAVVGAGNFARQISPPVQRRLASAAAPGGRGQVAQLRKIGRAISSEIEVQLSYLMDEVFSDTDPEYDEASTLFSRIDEDSQDTNVKRWLENASVATGNVCFSNIATLVIEGGVRTNFYPSGCGRRIVLTMPHTRTATWCGAPAIIQRLTTLRPQPSTISCLFHTTGTMLATKPIKPPGTSGTTILPTIYTYVSPAIRVKGDLGISKLQTTQMVFLTSCIARQ
jgi:hypothetical protein